MKRQSEEESVPGKRSSFASEIPAAIRRKPFLDLVTERRLSSRCRLLNRAESTTGTLLDNSIMAHQYQLTQSTPLSPPMMPAVPEPGREKKMGVIYQSCEWDGMIYTSKGQLCKFAKVFLEDVLRRTEHDIKNHFEETSRQCKLVDLAMAAEIYQYLLEDATGNSQKTGDILSIIQRKLLQVIRNLQSQKSYMYGTLPQLVFEYFWSQIIPNVVKNELQNDSLVKLGQFYGTLCNEFSIKDGVKQLIFETLYWRPPNAFAMAVGLLRVCPEVYGYQSFDDYSLRDRAILWRWRNDQLSGGVFAACLRAFGETFEASVEKADRKKVEGIQAALKCLLESYNTGDFLKQAIVQTLQKIDPNQKYQNMQKLA